MRLNRVGVIEAGDADKYHAGHHIVVGDDGRSAFRAKAPTDGVTAVSEPIVNRNFSGKGEGRLSYHRVGAMARAAALALPSDVARASPTVRHAYQQLVVAMVGLFEQCLGDRSAEARKQALSLAVSCVGGMILARTLPESGLAREIREVALEQAMRVTAG